MKKKITMLCLLICVISVSFNSACHQQQKQAETTLDTIKVRKDTIVSAKIIKVEKCIDTSFINQDLSFNLLGIKIFSADSNKIKKLFSEPVTLRIHEKIEQGEINYLYSYTANTDSINLFYKPNEGFYLENGNIESKFVNLNKKIEFGMDKASFSKLINMKNIECDTIKVTDEEMNMKSVFIFKNDRLVKIKIAQTLE